VLNQHIFRVDSFINTRFHKYLVDDALTALTTKTHGSGMVHITRKPFHDHPVWLPPLAEQERIVAAIEEEFSRLDAGVAALERARQNLRRMRAAVLHAAVTGHLIGVQEPWPTRPLGDVLVSIHAGKSFRCEERPARPEEWGVLKVSSMTWGEFRADENKTVLPGRQVDERLEVRSGDVLLSRSNTVEYVGSVVRVGQCRPRLLLSDKSLRIVPGPEVTSEWLVIALRSEVARRYIESVATGTSDSMRNISQPKIRALAIPVPSIDAQRQAVAAADAHLASIEALETFLSAGRQRQRALRSSVLRAAVSGRLVPQCPEDEPASALLEQIDAENATSPGREDGVGRRTLARRRVRQ